MSSLESKKFKHFIIKLLQQQLNELNRECQESQKRMHIELKKIFESQRNTPNNKIFTQKFEELFADYSMILNEIGFNYIAKIGSYLENHGDELSQSSPVSKAEGSDNTHNIQTTNINENDNNYYPNCVNLSSSTQIDIDNDDEMTEDENDDESYEREIITRSRSKSILRNNNNKQSKCTHCDKIFASKQALAGHIKVHNNNNKSNAKAQAKTKNDDCVFECHICHKKFSSKKSLSGHKGGAHKDYFANGGHHVSLNNKKMTVNVETLTDIDYCIEMQ